MIDLMNGDCLELMKDMPDDSIDLVLTDPPYGTTQCKWDSVIPLDKMWAELKHVGKSNAIYAFTASQPFSSALVMSNTKMFKHEWIWIKNRGSNFANTVREPMKEHEVVLIFSNGKWTYNKQMQERSESGLARTKYAMNHNSREHELYNDFSGVESYEMEDLRVPSSWQKFNVAAGKEKTKHHTQKPVELMEYLIRTYSNENDTVLDFTMGSGTTGVACVNTNRNFTGIELDEKYFEIAKDRIEKPVDKKIDSTKISDITDSLF